MINTEKKIKKLKKRIIKCSQTYGVAIKLPSYEIIDDGERIIFDVKLKDGTKSRTMFERAQDIQAVLGLPLFHPFKEGLAIRIAVSKSPAMKNSLKDILASLLFSKCGMKIPLAIGYDVRGKMRIIDLSKIKHLLMGGSSNSGKTVALICLVFSIIAKQSANDVNLLLFDIGANGLDVFEDIPHLSHPIVKDAETGIRVMLSLVEEMERRITLGPKEAQSLPSIVCVVDEFVSFMSNINDKKESEALIGAISNLLRRGRHANIHMVFATQNPKVRNMAVDLDSFRAKMAFAVAKPYHSVTILGEGGAEKLPGKGAMLLKLPEQNEPVYIQGAYISDEEIRKVIAGKAFQKMISEEQDYSNKFVMEEFDITKSLGVLSEPDGMSGAGGASMTLTSQSNKKLSEIIMWTLGRDKISANAIKKEFRMDKLADDMIAELFMMKLISDKFAKQPRVVLPQNVEEVPDEVMEFLARFDYTSEDVTKVIEQRGSDCNENRDC